MFVWLLCHFNFRHQLFSDVTSASCKLSVGQGSAFQAWDPPGHSHISQRRGSQVLPQFWGLMRASVTAVLLLPWLLCLKLYNSSKRPIGISAYYLDNIISTLKSLWQSIMPYSWMVSSLISATLHNVTNLPNIWYALLIMICIILQGTRISFVEFRFQLDF